MRFFVRTVDGRCLVEDFRNPASVASGVRSLLTPSLQRAIIDREQNRRSRTTGSGTSVSAEGYGGLDD